MQTTDHIKCTISLELEKRFLDSIKNENEKSLDEFRQLMENPEIIHHIAIMPKTAMFTATSMLQEIPFMNMHRVFEMERVLEAIPLHVALQSGSVEKVSTILDVLNLSNDQAGINNFGEQLRKSLISAGEFNLAEVVDLGKIVKVAIYHLLRNEKETDRQNLIQLLSKGFSLSASVPGGWCGEIVDIIKQFKKQEPAAETLLFLKTLGSEIDTSRLVEFEKTKGLLNERERCGAIIINETSLPMPCARIVIEYSNHFPLAKSACSDFSECLLRTEVDPNNQKALLVLFNNHNPYRNRTLAFVEDNSAEDAVEVDGAQKPKSSPGY